MVTTDYFVDYLYGLLAEVDESKFIDSKDAKSEAENYIVINSKGITTTSLQKCFLNVNCHAKDLGLGVPNRIKLKEMKEAVLLILEKYTETENNIRIDFKGDERFREEKLGEHYDNLKFEASIIGA